MASAFPVSRFFGAAEAADSSYIGQSRVNHHVDDSQSRPKTALGPVAAIFGVRAARSGRSVRSLVAAQGLIVIAGGCRQGVGGRYAADWLGLKTMAAGTEESYGRIMCLHILPQLGRKTISQVSPAHVEELYAYSRRQGAALNTIDCRRISLSGMFSGIVPSKASGFLTTTPHDLRHKWATVTLSSAHPRRAAMDGPQLD
ncbi:hypothetical protein [Streptomyces nigrescens]|uniref:hypothetical protein n=1 Tax=Streptomyces nigrescens TaxID=1920 RepID=UPI0034925A16